MTNKHLVLLLTLAAAPQAYAQTTTYVFQNGLELSNGVVYQGTDDVEFSSADLLNSSGERGQNPTISVDGSDGGNVTQGALRFSNLLASEGGVIPDAVTSGGLAIANARIEYWKTSGTGAETEIAFHQVIGVDNVTGDFWTEEDSWGGTVGDLADVGPNATFIEWPFGPALGPQFTPEGFTLDGFPIAPTGETATDGINPVTGLRQIYTESTLPQEVSVPLLAGGFFTETGDTTTDLDSEDLLNGLDDLVDNNTASFVDVFNAAFFSLDVTDTVVDWLVNGAPNQGWSISNNSTDGWDIFSSEAEGQITSQNDDLEIFEGATPLTGANLALLNTLVANDELPAGLRQATDSDDNVLPGFITLEGEGLRPKLIIEIAGAGGPADFNLDEVTDLLDYQLFLNAFGGQIDGQLDRGSVGDLDFDADVDTQDFQLFKQFFEEAQGMTLAEALAVPEPSTTILSLLGALAFAGRRRV